MHEMEWCLRIQINGEVLHKMEWCQTPLIFSVLFQWLQFQIYFTEPLPIMKQLFELVLQSSPNLYGDTDIVEEEDTVVVCSACTMEVPKIVISTKTYTAFHQYIGENIDLAPGGVLPCSIKLASDRIKPLTHEDL